MEGLKVGPDSRRRKDKTSKEGKREVWAVWADEERTGQKERDWHLICSRV